MSRSARQVTRHTPSSHRPTGYRGLDRRVVLLAVVRGVNTTGFSIVLPFLAMFLVDERGASGATYGAVYLVAGLAAALGNAVSGEASDRLGRRVMMMAALLLRSVNMMLLGLAVVAGATIWVIGVLVVVNAVLRSMFDPAASAAVTDLTAPAQRPAAFGLQRIGTNLGWAVGPALGGALAAAHSYGALFFVSSAIMLVAAAAVMLVRIPPRVTAPAEGGVATTARTRRPAFRAYLVLLLVATIMTMQIFATLSVFARTELGLSQRDIGLLYTVNAVLVVLFQLPAVVFIERCGPGRALAVGPLVYSAAFVGVGLSQDFWQLAAAMVLLTAGEVIFAPALSDATAHLGDPRRLGRAFGLAGLVQQLGVSLGPLAGGLVYDHLRDHHLAMWGTFAAGMAATSLGYAIFARLAPRDP